MAGPSAFYLFEVMSRAMIRRPTETHARIRRIVMQASSLQFCRRGPASLYERRRASCLHHKCNHTTAHVALLIICLCAEPGFC
jgi:hypothetical protein